jgi:hypothetical protein
MNERIRKLIRTETTILFPGTDEVDCDIAAIEKFAELIVRECAEMMPQDNLYKMVLKHFGVEE